MNGKPLEQPSVFLPLVLSFVGLAMVVGHAASFGIVHQADEGTAAHVFQLLMVAQVPIVGFFAVEWLPRAPVQALQVLVLQAGAALAAIAAVHFLTSARGLGQGEETPKAIPGSRGTSTGIPSSR